MVGKEFGFGGSAQLVHVLNHLVRSLNRSVRHWECLRSLDVIYRIDSFHLRYFWKFNSIPLWSSLFGLLGYKLRY